MNFCQIFKQMTSMKRVSAFKLLFFFSSFILIINQTIKCDDSNFASKYAALKAAKLLTNRAEQKVVYTLGIDVGFDMDYGGMYGIVFVGTPAAETNETIRNYEEERNLYEKVMQLSTIHTNTFVLDGTPGACTMNGKADGSTMKFCEKHQRKYDRNNSATSLGEIYEITNEPNGTGKQQQIGFSVQDDIRFGLSGHDLVLKMLRIEVMNGLAANDKNYWGRTENSMDGRLSLGRNRKWKFIGGRDYHLEESGALTPMQLLVAQQRMPFYGPISFGLVNSRCTEQIFSSCWQEAVRGTFWFGTLSAYNCPYWRKIDGKAINQDMDWSIRLSKFEIASNDGHRESSIYFNQTVAVIDTTTDKIVVPDSEWDQVQEMLMVIKCDCCLNLTANDRECADQLAQNPAIILHIDGHMYKMPSTHYFDMRKFVGNTDPMDCRRALQIVKNPNAQERHWHLGLPFLRTSCVATDYDSPYSIWLSGGIPYNGGVLSGMKCIQIMLTIIVVLLQILHIYYWQ